MLLAYFCVVFLISTDMQQIGTMRALLAYIDSISVLLRFVKSAC